MKLFLLLFLVSAVLSTLNVNAMKRPLCLDGVPSITNEEQALRWKHADRPNYNTNIDMRFPYSEVPYLEDYGLVKIPAAHNDLIQHVDYWGEGKIVSDEGVRGFPSCYNVNHQYQLVSSGQDLNKKIPNRIPVRSKDDCDTSDYVMDNSTLIVTVAAAHLTSSCAKDIVRIINSDHGKVVVFREQDDSQEVAELDIELQKIGLIAIPNATLPCELQGLTYYISHVSFLNKHNLENELYNTVVTGNYNTAVNMVQSFGEASSDKLIHEIVPRLVRAVPRNVMSFAYKLWIGGAKHCVRKHFPRSFQNIFNEDAVTLVNQQYGQPLKFCKVGYDENENTSIAWGATYDSEITGQRVSWKVLPVWKSDGIRFKLYGIDRERYLKLDVNVNNNGDRKGLGSNDLNEDEHLFYLEPFVNKGTEVFFIVNQQYEQTLNLDVNVDQVGDRLVLGHDNSESNTSEKFMWIIAAWSSSVNAVEFQR